MKANVDRAETRRVLADILDAVRPVERARTATAVDRVLATAAYGHRRMSSLDCPGGARCECRRWNRVWRDRQSYSTGHSAVADHYAPWVISPHLFGDQS